MRRIGTLFAMAMMLLGSLLIAAAPTAAAPAEPISYSNCYDVDGGFEYCYQEHGVIKQTTSQSGNRIWVMNAQSCSQIYYLGEVMTESCSTYNATLLAVDGGGEAHANPSRSTNEYTFEYLGTTYTCTTSSHTVYANGELRREDFQYECNPPLPV